MGGAKIYPSGAETSVSLEENGFGAIPRSKQPFAWDEERFWTTFGCQIEAQRMARHAS